ncbi:MAG: GAF domain-containing protein [Cyclobacteriaceae bacterium]
MKIARNFSVNKIESQLLILVFTLVILLIILFSFNFVGNRNIRQALETVKSNYALMPIQLEQLQGDLELIGAGKDADNLTEKIAQLSEMSRNIKDEKFISQTDSLLVSINQLSIEGNPQLANNLLIQFESLQKYHEQLYLEKLASISSSVANQNIFNLTLIAILITGTIIFGYHIRASLVKSLQRPIRLMKNLAEGKLPENVKTTKNEFHELISLANKLVDNLRAASNFALNIGQSKFDDDYQPSSDNDILGNALINMRNQLLEVDQESQKRNWSNEGYAKFGEILRKQSDDIHEFGFSIISGLVKYINGNQGAIYTIQEDPEDEQLQVLTRIGTYAYGRNKYIEDIIKPGSGLVGQAFLEQETIHMIDIPDDYIKIVSGLGDAPPKSLIIVPMKFNDQIYGVIEIASFNTFKKHEVDFLETIAESIASTISNVRINEKTKQLLLETQEQAEQLRTQEEEMRQNMEELSATHEQVERLKLEEERKNKEMIAKIEDYKNMLMRVIDNVPGKIFIKDHEGRLVLLNQAVANAYNTTVDELLGTTDFDYFSFEVASEYRRVELEILESGRPLRIPEEMFRDQDGNIRILDTLKMPFEISGEEKIGLLGIQSDITKIKDMERKFKEQKVEMQREIDSLKMQLEEKKK